MAILPLHRRHLSSSSRSMLLREKYILFLIFIAFCAICFGAFYFVPDSTFQEAFHWERDFKHKNPNNAPQVQPPIHHHIGVVVETSHSLPVSAEKSSVVSTTALPALPNKPVSEPASNRQDDVTTPAPAQAGQTMANDENAKRRDFIKQMTRHAWTGYEKYAMGQNELKPISRRGHSASIFGGSSLGATIVDSLDTLYIMGLKDEYAKARRWVEEHLNFDVTSQISVFEMTIRFVGGLLSAHALTHDELYKTKAIELTKKILPAFNSGTGLPYAAINLNTGSARNWHWAAGGCSILAEVGTMHLEFAYLTQLTGDPVYLQKVEKARDHLEQVAKPNGLYYNYINPNSGQWCQRHVSMGALGDSFYEYLLKSWLQSGKKDARARKMYDKAMADLEPLLQRSKNDKLLYYAEKKEPSLMHKMDHLACFSGGMLALGALDSPPDIKKKYLEQAGGITHTCHESYARTATKLGPESFYFTDWAEAKGTSPKQRYYIQRPEVIEAYFYMWRITKEQKYRDWGWEAAQAIEKHCRVNDGYSGIRDVDQVPVSHDDVQQSFLLAETFKYLYLLFSDDSTIPLNEWVLNTEAHPLPIVKVP